MNNDMRTARQVFLCQTTYLMCCVYKALLCKHLYVERARFSRRKTLEANERHLVDFYPCQGIREMSRQSGDYPRQSLQEGQCANKNSLAF